VRIKIVVALSAVLAASAGFGLLSDAGAGPTPAVNTFRVVKVLEGPVPAGAVFEVEVVCTPDINSAPSTELVAATTFEFDENGDPIGPDSVGVGLFETCTAEETVTNGAAVAYACQVSQVAGAATEGSADVACVDDQTVHFGEVAGAEGLITVTNTFEAAPPPPPPPPPDVLPDDDTPGVVDATPTFTG